MRKILGMPAWNPIKDWLAVGVDCPSCGPTKQLWLMALNGERVKEITQDGRYAHASYSWDLSGRYLLFQRLKTGSSDAEPEILIWDSETDQTRLIAKNAALPRWLP